MALQRCSSGDGHADLGHVFAAAEGIARALAESPGYTVVVTKSTVPVGTGRQVSAILSRLCPPERFDVTSNPEFLREGSAIEDFMRPDRVVIGAEAERAREVMRQLYRPFYLIETPMLFTDIETAELIKCAANAYLATKITFINEIADLCEALDADVQDAARGIGLDGRIGGKFLHAGPGFGGSCFPKDCRALVRTAQDAAAGLTIVETVLAGNEARKARMAEKIVSALGGPVADKRLAVLGLSFKPNNDDMREAPSLAILPRLIAAGATIRAFDPAGATIRAFDPAGATIRAFDPAGVAEAKKLLPELVYCPNAYTAIAGADALVLLTEWNEFRALDLARVARLLKRPLVVDLRNIYRPAEMDAAGLSYFSVGRPARPARRPFTGNP